MTFADQESVSTPAVWIALAVLRPDCAATPLRYLTYDPIGMTDYDEPTYFDGAHFSHIAAWQMHRRLQASLEANRLAVERNQAGDDHGGDGQPSLPFLGQPPET